MKQTDGALKQDCCGVNSKHHAAERWDLEFVFQTPQKKIYVVFEPNMKFHLMHVSVYLSKIIWFPSVHCTAL